MKLHDPRTEFEGSLPENRKTFQLKSNPKMFKILSDGIYADKIAAVIRELSCNAFDSTVVAKAKPFIVNVPTTLDPTFFVEDFGTGIDPDKIVDIFWTYGESTKTKSNDQIGALGLGSKSPFAYTKSSFGVRNRYNGVEHTYFCFINEDGIPDGSEIARGATIEPNGVRVDLAVKLEDIRSFRERIIRFFSFWDPKNLPIFSGDSKVLEDIKAIHANRTLSGSNWQLRSVYESAGNKAYAVMGGVPYPINRQALSNVSKELDAICGAPINIVFPIGALDFQVSREELAYEDVTIRALESVAKGICDELLTRAVTRLTGLATPFELWTTYEKVKAETNERLAFVARLLENTTFKLLDGRTFTGKQLQNTYHTFTINSHLPINVSVIEHDVRDYSKGRQHYSLTTKLDVVLSKPEERNPVTKVLIARAYDNTIEWFRPDTQPQKQVNTQRRRTAANYLADGFTATKTSFEGRFGKYVHFIINDIGERGTEGMRFYTGNLRYVGTDPLLTTLSRAYSDRELFFVDGFFGGKIGADAEAVLRELLKDSVLEGVPVTFLSKLPDFALPTAVKADPKPRAPHQRGTVEQRMAVYTLEGVEVTESIEDFDVKFHKASQHVNAYVRHQLDKPMLYVQTNWGNPTTNIDKILITNETIGALHMLGLFNDFVTPHPTSTVAGAVELRIGMLPATAVEDLTRRGVKLIELKTLAETAVQKMLADTELVAAFQDRPAGEDYDDDRVTLKKMMSKTFMRCTLPKLKADNAFAKIANVRNHIASLMRGRPDRVALMHLCFSAFKNQHVMQGASVTLRGKLNIKNLLRGYPIMELMAQGLQYRTHEEAAFNHLALYINAVDAEAERQAEAKRQEFLAKLEAESIFEGGMHQPV